MLAEVSTANWTAQQLHAIESRSGELFLDAAAGSGKTSVLVERFVRSVLEDGIDMGSILAITFTEKAAAEMRERIRARLRELGANDAARAAEGAVISTIHGFCAAALRSHALGAGVDPGFAVLDEAQAASLASQAFEMAIEELAESAGGRELIASYGIGDLRVAILSVYGQLRSGGQLRPRLPALGAAPDLAPAGERLAEAAVRVLGELVAVAEPSARVLTAIERLERVPELAALPWPGDVERLRLPGGNGAALTTEACARYLEALEALRDGAAHHFALGIRDQFEVLLGSFADRYERLKRRRSSVDFEDLELLCLGLLRSRPAVAARYRERFERMMVDELQDTNAVQLALVEAIADGNLFTVGDAQQSIYGFRHAAVELFERRGEALGAAGARATLTVNFRSEPEILEVINRVFGQALGERFVPLVAGRQAGPRQDRVELLIVDRGAEETSHEVPAPESSGWRMAEARTLAERVAELIAGGAAPRDVVVLTRAATDIRVYERALEEHGVPTYVIGGRGYWSHPQVIDVLAYLRLLANPRDEEALYTVLVSPMVGVSYDGLVLIAAAARTASRDPWWVLRQAPVDELSDEDRCRLERFMAWADGERRGAARRGVQELIDRMLDRTGYDLAVLRMPGGERRLANVRKLMRLGREHQAAHGPDLRGFLEMVAERSRGGPRAEEESEAPVEGEALDAVRLMTIHRAKGLEFPIVCVADLGRLPRWGGDVLRVGEDGSLGIRLARPGTGGREAALDYAALGQAQREAEAREERRLFYVAATRARERLIFSAAANVQAVWGENPGAAPIGWLGPALVPDLPALLARGIRAAEGVRFTASPLRSDVAPAVASAALTPPRASATPSSPEPAAAPRSLSYTALAGFRRCGYRFYAERVLGLPAFEPAGAPAGGELGGAERGTIVHSLLERLDFGRPSPPSTEAIGTAVGRRLSRSQSAEIAQLIERFCAGELCARLGRARALRREQPFGFLLGDMLITGALDVLADEDHGAALVVDYKTDRLDGRSPDSVVAEAYLVQRLVYALAALRAGYECLEVVHVFLEQPEDLVVAAYTAADRERLEDELGRLVEQVGRAEYQVSQVPHRTLCSGCPAEGGLCSWPLEMTRRQSPQALF